MKFDSFKTNFSNFCRRVGKRNFIIIGAVVLTVAVVAVNLVMFSNRQDDGFDYSQSAGMDSGNTNTGTNNDANGDQQTEDSYFSSVMINRQRSRDEAIEVLQSIVDNESATETAKNEALSQINQLASVMEAESNIETLIVAKGFAECVAVISDGGASIVVKCDGLQAAQISQINEIVYEQAGIVPANIKIIER